MALVSKNSVQLVSVVRWAIDQDPSGAPFR
jgi:hypothetical protein